MSSVLDHGQGHVDGVRDLIDFFPLAFDVKKILELFPPSKFTYRLRHENAAVNVFKTDISAQSSEAYLKDPDVARQYRADRVQRIIGDTYKIDPATLEKLASADRKVMLFEVNAKTEKPLLFEVSTEKGVVCTIPFPLKSSDVEDMFRMENLVEVVDKDNPGIPEYVGAQDVVSIVPSRRDEPKNYPDTLCDESWFIFVHGCCTSQDNARGWHSEIFKRMYWAGSKAKFLGITWRGDESTGWMGLAGKTPNYHQNVIYAFATGRYLAGFINGLEGKKCIVGHSLGNIVVSTAINDGVDGVPNSGDEMNVDLYCMTNAAIPVSAFDESKTFEDAMIHPEWQNFKRPVVDSDSGETLQVPEKRFFATYWYNLFIDDQTDPRNLLKWEGRFRDVPRRTSLINYYSSGEEVLQNAAGAIPHTGYEFLLGGRPSSGVWGGVRVWAAQELTKGRYLNDMISSPRVYDIHGGWGFNLFYWDINLRVEYEKVKDVPNDALRVTPVFLDFRIPGVRGPLEDPESKRISSEFYVKAVLLAEAIPSLSFAAGSNSIKPRDQSFPVVDINMNVDSDGIIEKTKWPIRSTVHSDLQSRWLHCDLRNMAYCYTFRLFESWSQKFSTTK